MITLDLVGMGMGDPGHLTLAAIARLRAAGAILLPLKGEEKRLLADVRRGLIAAAGVEGTPVVPIAMPERDPTLPYGEAVERWHDAIADRWLVALKGLERVALLVWGDPSLYDSALRIAGRLATRIPLTVTVTPGITALQALTAAFAMPLNAVGEPVLITTGRRLRESGWPSAAATVAVMLDAGGAFTAIDPEGVTIHWGAYLGLPQQRLLHGPLAALSPEILATRAALRAEHGWIMDTYLLRRG